MISISNYLHQCCLPFSCCEIRDDTRISEVDSAHGGPLGSLERKYTRRNSQSYTTGGTVSTVTKIVFWRHKELPSTCLRLIIEFNDLYTTKHAVQNVKQPVLTALS